LFDLAGLEKVGFHTFVYTNKDGKPCYRITDENEEDIFLHADERKGIVLDDDDE